MYGDNTHLFYFLKGYFYFFNFCTDLGVGARSYSVMVITKDSDSFNPGSSPGRTFFFVQDFLN